MRKMRLLEKARKYDGLAEDYLTLVGTYDELVDRIGKAAFYFNHVAAMYTNVAASPEATEEDKLEFNGKASGLREANAYIIDILKTCLGSEEEENDLPGETERTESSV